MISSLRWSRRPRLTLNVPQKCSVSASELMVWWTFSCTCSVRDPPLATTTLKRYQCLLLHYEDWFPKLFVFVLLTHLKKKKVRQTHKLKDDRLEAFFWNTVKWLFQNMGPSRIPWNMKGKKKKKRFLSLNSIKLWHRTFIHFYAKENL